VAIKYRLGTEEKPREWSGRVEDNLISRVSVFDAHSAAVYLTEKTDVAFRPFGLDLFDKLVQACKSVRTQLQDEQRSLPPNSLADMQSQIPEGTVVAKLLANITLLTKPEEVKALSRLSPEQEARLANLEKSLLDLQANDPDKLIRQLTLRADHAQALAQHIKEVEAALSAKTIDSLFIARTEVLRKSEEALKLRKATFPPSLLDGTGSESWSELWESARTFSQELAYPDQLFPVVENGANCVLCQQDLDHAARHRLKQFEEFVTSTSEQELQQARTNFANLHRNLTDLKVTNEAIGETLKEIRIEHEDISDTIESALATAETHRQTVDLALSSDQGLSSDCPALTSFAAKAYALAAQIAERAETLRTSATTETLERISAEVRELRARKLLAAHQEIVLDEIERKKKHAAYDQCIKDTRTHLITQKSTAVTRSTVTQKLKRSFQSELSKLNFQLVEVELKEVGGAEGVLYHKLVLMRAPGIELPKVVSEGEQRCLSIAAFFAELSTADDSSGIVFDDPVSSLDYRWRGNVARRLVEEAKKRQVIVFTHDVVFLLLLKQSAGEQCVKQLDQHVRQLSSGAGVCAEELPWVALKVAKRIRHLKKLCQDAEKMHREGHQDAYEREASLIYGLLREAWERSLEEVLLGGVVERYRPSIQTQQIALIADITIEDCKTVESAMTKCSRWLAGHDQAPAARADIPAPPELKADIDALENWVGDIRRRR